jgi:RNA polymerase sigma factor (sigma-70 family)
MGVEVRAVVRQGTSPPTSSAHLAPAAPNPEQELIALQDGERLRNAIADLPSPFLETLVMRDINGLSYREIAEATETPVGTVMSRLARARALLAKTLRAEA